MYSVTSERVSDGTASQSAVIARRPTISAMKLKLRGTTVAAGLLALALTGCGSTVNGVGQIAGSGGSQLGNGLDDGLGLSTDVPAAETPGAQTRGGVDPTGSSSTPDTATDGGSDVVTDTPTSTGAPIAVTPSTKPLPVGYFVLKDTGGAFKALGFDGLSSGNGVAQVNASVKLVNSRGGVGGRQIKAVIYEGDATSNPSALAEAACAKFFEDNHVEAVVSVTFLAGLSTCSQKRSVPFISDGTGSTSDKSLAANPYLVMPNQLTFEQVGHLLTSGLVSSGWITKAKKPVIGLITADSPDFRNIPGIVTAELKKAGLAITETAYMPAEGIGDAATQGKAAALKFKARGVTHVIGVDAGGFDLSWFTLNAGQQGYYPKIGLSSQSLPSGFPSLFSNKQLNGSAGVGWAPAVDNSVANQKPVSQRTTDCLNAARAAGEDTNGLLVRAEAQAICDATFFISDTFKTGTVTGAAMQAGIKALTGGFVSAIAFKSDPAKSRAAVASYRPFAFVDSCKCYQYNGPVKSVR